MVTNYFNSSKLAYKEFEEIVNSANRSNDIKDLEDLLGKISDLRSVRLDPMYERLDEEMLRDRSVKALDLMGFAEPEAMPGNLHSILFPVLKEHANLMKSMNYFCSNLRYGKHLLEEKQGYAKLDRVIIQDQTRKIALSVLKNGLNVETVEKLGEGFYGVVEEVRFNEEVIVRKHLHDITSLSTLEKERSLLLRLDHPNILKFLGFSTLSLFYEKAERTWERQSYAGFTRPILFQALKDIFNGLAYLQKMDVLHRDIKPDNLLIRADGSSLIADFGSAGKFGIGGAWSYSAPEVILKQEQTSKVDIWGLGATLHFVLSGKRALFIFFSESLAEKKMEALSAREKTWHKELLAGIQSEADPSGEFRYLMVNSMLRSNPENRLSADKILKTALFEERRSIKKKKRPFNPE